MNDGYVKALEVNYGGVTTIGASRIRGMYLSADTSDQGGKSGLRVGDGFHNYILVSFVSCLTNAIPKGALVTSAVLTLTANRVFGKNPVEYGGCCQARVSVDMVRRFSQGCCCRWLCTSSDSCLQR